MKTILFLVIAILIVGGLSSFVPSSIKEVPAAPNATSTFPVGLNGSVSPAGSDVSIKYDSLEQVINPANDPDLLYSIRNKVGDAVLVSFTSRTQGGGYYGIYTKLEGSWVKVVGGQDFPRCIQLDQFHVSREIYSSCYTSDFKEEKSSDTRTSLVSPTLTVSTPNPYNGKEHLGNDPITFSWSASFPTRFAAVRLVNDESKNAWIIEQLESGSQSSGQKNGGYRMAANQNIPAGSYHVEICDVGVVDTSTKQPVCGMSKSFSVKTAVEPFTP